ncbi:hypothetical protein [Kitasatospora indigofera]|nr:hypothetical protein [Kitasatospora indigofera]
MPTPMFPRLVDRSPRAWIPAPVKVKEAVEPFAVAWWMSFW